MYFPKKVNEYFMITSKVESDLVFMPWHILFASVCKYLFPKGMGIVYEAEIIHFGHKRQPSFLTTATVFQPLFSEQKFSSQISEISHSGKQIVHFPNCIFPYFIFPKYVFPEQPYRLVAFQIFLNRGVQNLVEK